MILIALCEESNNETKCHEPAITYSTIETVKAWIKVNVKSKAIDLKNHLHEEER